MIQVINNSPGKGDNLKVITDKCNDNFKYLDGSISKIVEDSFKNSKFITLNDIPTTFELSNIKGLDTLLANLVKEIEVLKKENEDFKQRLSIIDNDNYNIAKVVLDNNKLVSELKR